MYNHKNLDNIVNYLLFISTSTHEAFQKTKKKGERKKRKNRKKERKKEKKTSTHYGKSHNGVANVSHGTCCSFCGTKYYLLYNIL